MQEQVRTERGILLLTRSQTFLEQYHNPGATTILVPTPLVVEESDRRLSTSNPQSPMAVQQLLLIAGPERIWGVQKPALSKCC